METGRTKRTRAATAAANASAQPSSRPATTAKRLRTSSPSCPTSTISPMKTRSGASARHKSKTRLTRQLKKASVRGKRTAPLDTDADDGGDPEGDGEGEGDGGPAVQIAEVEIGLQTPGASGSARQLTPVPEPVTAMESKGESQSQDAHSVLALLNDPIVDVPDSASSSSSGSGKKNKGKGKATPTIPLSPPQPAHAQVIVETDAALAAELASQQQLIAKHTALLSSLSQSLTCQVCFELLRKPYTLAPCGHTACLSCLVAWFSAPPPGQESDEPEPANAWGRRKTCPHCRGEVRERPAEAFAIKDIVRSLVRSDLLPNAAPPASPQLAPDDGGADPWARIFRPAGGPHHVYGRDLDFGFLDEEDGHTRRCWDCMHEIWDGQCTNCRRMYEVEDGWGADDADFDGLDIEEDVDYDHEPVEDPLNYRTVNGLRIWEYPAPPVGRWHRGVYRDPAGGLAITVNLPPLDAEHPEHVGGRAAALAARNRWRAEQNADPGYFDPENEMFYGYRRRHEPVNPARYANELDEEEEDEEEEEEEVDYGGAEDEYDLEDDFIDDGPPDARAVDPPTVRAHAAGLGYALRNRRHRAPQQMAGNDVLEILSDEERLADPRHPVVARARAMPGPPPRRLRGTRAQAPRSPAPGRRRTRSQAIVISSDEEDGSGVLEQEQDDDDEEGMDGEENADGSLARIPGHLRAQFEDEDEDREDGEDGEYAGRSEDERQFSAMHSAYVDDDDDPAYADDEEQQQMPRHHSGSRGFEEEDENEYGGRSEDERQFSAMQSVYVDYDSDTLNAQYDDEEADRDDDGRIINESGGLESDDDGGWPDQDGADQQGDYGYDNELYEDD